LGGLPLVICTVGAHYGIACCLTEILFVLRSGMPWEILPHSNRLGEY